MNLIRLVFIISAVSASSLVLAEGKNDPVYGRMIQQNIKAMQEYAADRGKNPPKVTHYRYGMKTDIHKVVNRTRIDSSCNVQPAQITYEDSSGELNILEYRAMGECKTHN